MRVSYWRIPFLGARLMHSGTVWAAAVEGALAQSSRGARVGPSNMKMKTP
jgi:hypothetical protein